MNDFVDNNLPDLSSRNDDILSDLDKLNREIEEKKGKKKSSKEEASKVEQEEKPKYSKEELLAIFDSLIFEGKYTETFKSRKISVTFRSRTGDDSVTISRAIDKFDGKTYVSVQTYTNLMTLSHSLVSFNDRTFGDKEIKEKFEFLISLPDAVLTILAGKLQEFDEKVWLAMEEGRKNF